MLQSPVKIVGSCSSATTNWLYELILKILAVITISMSLSLDSNRGMHTTLRINGVLPEISKFATEGDSERAVEIRNTTTPTNSSCSIISSTHQNPSDYFHMLVDVGQGVVKSLQKNHQSEIYSPDSS